MSVKTMQTQQLEDVECVIAKDTVKINFTELVAKNMTEYG